MINTLSNLMSNFLSHWFNSAVVFLPLPNWANIVLTLLFVSSFLRAFLWFYNRKLSLKSVVAILLSNLMLLLLIVFIIHRPYVERKQLLGSRNISITFDVSQSVQMVVGAESLLQIYKSLEEKIASVAKQQKLEVHYFFLANELHERAGRALTQQLLAAEARLNTETNFEKYLGGLAAFQDQKKIHFDSNLLFTDAFFNKSTEAILDHYEAQNKVSPVKIVFIHRQVVSDLAITSLNYYPIGFEGKDFTLNFKISNGYAPHLTLPVQIWDDRQLIFSKQYVLNALGEQALSLSFRPKGSGMHYFKVQIPRFANELTYLNNQREAEVLIRPNNLRVLQIAGQPSWDVRFMRKLLKKHPKFDLISFYILREMDDDNSVRPEEMSLIRFPSEQLFGTELTKFNFLIVHDFQFSKFLVNPDLINNIGNYVLGGGSMLLLGGHQSFLSYDYQPYEISKILPFVPLESPAQDMQNMGMMQLIQRFGKMPGFNFGETTFKNDAWLESSLKVNVTPIGKVHPITQFPVSFSESMQFPPLRNINKIKSLSKDANVLLEAVDEKGQVHPLLVCASRGKGRVCALLTDTSWLLAFDARANGLSMNIYQSLWMNSFSWLTSDAAYEPLSLDAVSAESNETSNNNSKTKISLQMASPKGVSKDWLSSGLSAEVLIKTGANGDKNGEANKDQTYQIKLLYDHKSKSFIAEWWVNIAKYQLQSLKVLNVSFGDMKMNLSNQTRQFSNGQDQTEFTFLQSAAVTAKLMENRIKTVSLPQSHKEVQDILLSDFQNQGEVKIYREPIWNKYWVFLLLCLLVFFHWYHHKRFGVL